MPDIGAILCPVDFSEFSRHALNHAVQLARWFKSDLTVLHVYSLPTPPQTLVYEGLGAPFPGGQFPPPTISPDGIRDAAGADLAQFTGGVDTSGLSVQEVLKPGSPVTGILEAAQTLPADLIVLGTHGHSGFDRWVLGSVTEKVLRKAACPVITVPPPVSAPPSDTLYLFKRILCPLDFSDASLKALEYALALAKEADAELLLLHVIEGLPNLENWQHLSDRSIVEYVRVSEQEALARLRHIVPEDARTWCRPEQLLATGKPYEEILRTARDRDVHLVVMGVHGRNPIDLMFFGSSTQQIVRASTCPVLTLRG